jgi:hypothetical protein
MVWIRLEAAESMRYPLTGSDTLSQVVVFSANEWSTWYLTFTGASINSKDRGSRQYRANAVQQGLGRRSTQALFYKLNKGSCTLWRHW